MLRVYFGEKPNAIYNTSLFFKNRYEDRWITDPFAQRVIKDIDKSEVIDGKTIASPVLGIIPPVQLSGGVKALLLMKNLPGKTFNASNCVSIYVLQSGRFFFLKPPAKAQGIHESFAVF